MKTPMILLVILVGLLGPIIFWVNNGAVILNDKPIVIDLESDNLEEYIGKIVALENVCLPDFVLKVTGGKGGSDNRELIPIVSCDSINQSNVKLFLKINAPMFGTLDDIYNRSEESEYGLFIGRLERPSGDLDGGSRRIIENAGFNLDLGSSFELNAHFNLWEQLSAEIFILLILFPAAAALITINDIKNRKKKKILHELLFGEKSNE